MIISIPSKTFFLGEYAALEQAPSILINTSPRFIFSIQENNTPNWETFFHKDSAAHKWVQKHSHLFSSTQVSLEDPYKGQGGFGLSSAEFNCVYLYSILQQQMDWYDADLAEMREEYRANQSSSVVIPSGADVISQWVGGLCLFNPAPFDVQTLNWSFSDLDFFLIRTGHKLSTWEHLPSVKEMSFAHLTKCVHEAFQMIQSEQEGDFIEIVKDYARILEGQKLITPHSLSILEKIRECKEVLAAKGCGALGAEVIIVLFKSTEKEKIQLLLKDYPIIGSAESLTHGIEVK